MSGDASPPGKRRRGLLVALAVAVLAGLVIAASVRWDEGGGQSLRSPDGTYEASASTTQRCGVFTRGPVRAVVRIVSRDGLEVRRLESSPIRSADAGYFRQVADLIRWSSDGRMVTIAYDGLEHRIAVDR